MTQPPLLQRLRRALTPLEALERVLVAPILRSRASMTGVSARGSACSSCDAGEWHRIFITAPPGWASVMPCGEATRPHGVVVLNDQQIQDMRDSRL